MVDCEVVFLAPLYALVVIRQNFAQLKGPLKYLLIPLLGKNQLAVTLHMYASIGPNLDTTHKGQII